MPELFEAAGSHVIDSLVEALETMAFISSMPGERSAAAPEHPRLVGVDFTAPRRGTIRLMADQSFGATLAANLIGVDPQSPEAQACADDALMELLNVTCGSAIRKLGHADDQRLHMSLPSIHPVTSSEQWNQFLNRPNVVVLDAEGQIIALEAIGLEPR